MMLNPVHRSAMTAMTGRSRLGPLAELSRNSTRLERTMASTTTTTTSRCMLSNNPHKTRLALSPPSPQHGRSYATTMAVSFPSLTDKEDSVLVSKTTAANNDLDETHHEPKVKLESCGDVDSDDDDDMEKEEMFVDPHESFEHKTREWGGPRRGGRLLEPTRFGDWERKGRCTDF